MRRGVLLTVPIAVLAAVGVVGLPSGAATRARAAGVRPQPQLGQPAHGFRPSTLTPLTTLTPPTPLTRRVPLPDLRPLTPLTRRVPLPHLRLVTPQPQGSTCFVAQRQCSLTPCAVLVGPTAQLPTTSPAIVSSPPARVGSRCRRPAANLPVSAAAVTAIPRGHLIYTAPALRSGP